MAVDLTQRRPQDGSRSTESFRGSADGQRRVAPAAEASTERSASPTCISRQLIGAYGERAVEGELLRRGWIASNVNASVKNAADFDVFAVKAGRTVHVRVKTCGPGINEFQFRFHNRHIPVDGIAPNDFSVMVCMGVGRADDEFYIMPTKDLRRTLQDCKEHYLKRSRRDGGNRKDTGHWTLKLSELRQSEDRPDCGLRRKWTEHREAWHLLDA